MTTHLVYISPGHMDPTYAIERAGLGPDVELRVMSNPDRGDMDGAEARDADAIITWRTHINEAAIDELERCKVIVRMGVGYDIVDVDAAKRRGIPVCNIPDYCTNEVADHTMALLLTLSRGLMAYNASVQSGMEGWEWSSAGLLYRLTGRTLGIVGLGRIGTAVAMRAKAFGMRVVFFDPYVRDGMDRALGLTRLTLDELLAEADAITFHTPLTDETRHLAGEDLFRKIKPGVFVVNTSRGGVLDAQALEMALREGRVAAAALDVLPTEPPDPELPLIRAWRAGEEWMRHRLVVTPHAAFYSEEGERDMRVKAAATARDVLDGGAPRNRVNP
jgi:phosphoglycerate dehydrogenase-like enzyme